MVKIGLAPLKEFTIDTSMQFNETTMRYMLTRGKIVSNINKAAPRLLCVKKVDKFLKFFLFMKGMPAAKNKPNALKLNI